MSITFNIFVCLNSGSVWELCLLAVNILSARFVSDLVVLLGAPAPTQGFHSLGVAIAVRCI